MFDILPNDVESVAAWAVRVTTELNMLLQPGAGLVLLPAASQGTHEGQPALVLVTVQRNFVLEGRPAACCDAWEDLAAVLLVLG